MTSVLKRLRRVVSVAVKEEGYSADGLKEDHARIDAARDAYFTLIEGVIIVGALQAAGEKSGSLVLNALWLIGFGLMALYMQSGAKYLLRLMVEELIPRQARDAALWLTGIIALGLSGLSVWIVSGLVSEVIRNSIMI